MEHFTVTAFQNWVAYLYCSIPSYHVYQTIPQNGKGSGQTNLSLLHHVHHTPSKRPNPNTHPTAKYQLTQLQYNPTYAVSDVGSAALANVDFFLFQELCWEEEEQAI